MTEFDRIAGRAGYGRGMLSAERQGGGGLAVNEKALRFGRGRAAVAL